MRAATERLRAQAGSKAAVGHHHAFLRLAVADPAPRRLHARRIPASTCASPPRRACRTSSATASTSRSATARPSLAGPNAVRLFGESVFPVCSPKLLEERRSRCSEPADLRHHVLLQYDDPDGRHPWLHWKTWLEVERIADLRPAGTPRLLRLRADHPGRGRRPRRGARPQPAGEGPARLGRAGGAVQAHRRSGARLLRHRRRRARRRARRWRRFVEWLKRKPQALRQ